MMDKHKEGSSKTEQQEGFDSHLRKNGSTWKNLKKGTYYTLLDKGIDCTNSRDGTEVAIYCQRGCNKRIYVREWEEFLHKFELVSYGGFINTNF